MKALGIVPARYASSRFPGKPLVPILGVPMVVRVARLTAEALGKAQTCVATDDERIATVVRDHGFDVAMTSTGALTGTDRLAEVAEQRAADVYVNVQGDEPMLDPANIAKVVEARARFPGEIVNAMCRLGPGEEPDNPNIPKVVTTEDGRLLYMSRRALPGYKDSKNAPREYWKQICIYAFLREELLAYARFGRKSAVEACEDIEILRFLELGIPIRMVEVSAGTLAVDNPPDVALVEEEMRRCGMQ